MNHLNTTTKMKEQRIQKNENRKRIIKSDIRNRIEEN
jgi:hypothetical protein